MIQANTNSLANPGAALQGAEDPEVRRLGAAMMGSARTERKAETARENGRRGGRPPGQARTPEQKAAHSAAMQAAWAQKRAAGETMAHGREAVPLDQLACTCGGEGLNHKSTCPRGRAIRRRRKEESL